MIFVATVLLTTCAFAQTVPTMAELDHITQLHSEAIKINAENIETLSTQVAELREDLTQLSVDCKANACKCPSDAVTTSVGVSNTSEDFTVPKKLGAVPRVATSIDYEKIAEAVAQRMGSAVTEETPIRVQVSDAVSNAPSVVSVGSPVVTSVGTPRVTSRVVTGSAGICTNPFCTDPNCPNRINGTLGGFMGTYPSSTITYSSPTYSTVTNSTPTYTKSRSSIRTVLPSTLRSTGRFICNNGVCRWVSN